MSNCERCENYLSDIDNNSITENLCFECFCKQLKIDESKMNSFLSFGKLLIEKSDTRKMELIEWFEVLKYYIVEIDL